VPSFLFKLFFKFTYSINSKFSLSVNAGNELVLLCFVIKGLLFYYFLVAID